MTFQSEKLKIVQMSESLKIVQMFSESLEEEEEEEEEEESYCDLILRFQCIVVNVCFGVAGKERQESGQEGNTLRSSKSWKKR